MPRISSSVTKCVHFLRSADKNCEFLGRKRRDILGTTVDRRLGWDFVKPRSKEHEILTHKPHNDEKNCQHAQVRGESNIVQFDAGLWTSLIGGRYRSIV